MKKTCSYIVLGQRPDKSVFGYTEHSFSMGFGDDRVRVNRSFESQYSANKHGKSERFLEYQNCLKQAENLRTRHIKDGLIFKVFRVGSKNCPVVIDWREIVAMRQDHKKNYDKFKWRNLPFKVKENVTF